MKVALTASTTSMKLLIIFPSLDISGYRIFSNAPPATVGSLEIGICTFVVHDFPAVPEKFPSLSYASGNIAK